MECEDDRKSVISEVTFDKSLMSTKKDPTPNKVGKEMTYDISDVRSEDHQSWLTYNDDDLVDEDMSVSNEKSSNKKQTKKSS